MDKALLVPAHRVKVMQARPAMVGPTVRGVMDLMAAAVVKVVQDITTGMD
jgi:hypothetical protein